MKTVLQSEISQADSNIPSLSFWIAYFIQLFRKQTNVETPLNPDVSNVTSTDRHSEPPISVEMTFIWIRSDLAEWWYEMFIEWW